MHKSQDKPQQNQQRTFPRPSPQKKLALLLVALVAGGLLIVQLWPTLTTLLADGERLRAWVHQLGPWGPVALIALGVVQVLVAPLPGYPIVFVCGALYGGFWGAIYANIGIMLAGVSAMLLARSLGRPAVERLVERGGLARLEGLLASDSVWLWFIVLLLPTGDLPYFAAGLSRLRLRDFMIALAAARLPFTFVLTTAAAHALTLPRQALLLALVPLLLLGVLGYWQQEQISKWVHQKLEKLAPSPSPDAH